MCSYTGGKFFFLFFKPLPKKCNLIKNILCSSNVLAKTAPFANEDATHSSSNRIVFPPASMLSRPCLSGQTDFIHSSWQPAPQTPLEMVCTSFISTQHMTAFAGAQGKCIDDFQASIRSAHCLDETKLNQLG